MQTNLKPRLWVIAMCIVASAIPAVSQAQRTGTLSTETLEDSLRRLRGLGVTAEDAVRSQLLSRVRTQLLSAQNRAVLLFDPELSSAMRASAHALNVVFDKELREGRLQLNLCDLTPKGCESTSMLLMIAGPLNDNEAVDLVDRRGLVGEARVEVSVTPKLIRPTGILPEPTLRGTVARPTFSFRSSPSLATAKERPWAYRFEPGLSLRKPTWWLFGGWVYERTFDPQTKQTVCTPASFGPTGTTVCSDMIVGAPTTDRTNGLLLEAKASFAGRFAFGMTFEHDFLENDTSFEVPIYFLSTTATGTNPALAGGARIGFRTNEKTTFTIFIDTFKL